MMHRTFMILGAISAGLSVAAGAFGAHALRERVEPRLLEVFETAARYQMYHALALFAVAWVITRGADMASAAQGVAQGAAPGVRMAVAAGWLFVAGTVVFSGSLYAMTFTGIRGLGAITPIGGVCFLAGWVCLAVAAARTI